MSDQYKTISALSEGLYKEKGSKFFAYAYPVLNEEDFKSCMEEQKKAHPKGRHHCFAYRMLPDGSLYRSNDDGEPSGTAGRPILGQIDSFGLTNVFVVVVRYFGGTKLGVPGLIHAYKESTRDALANAVIEERLVKDIYKITFDYGVMGEVMAALKKAKTEVVEQVFETEAYVKVAFQQSKVEEELLRLRALILKVSEEEAAITESIEDVEIVFEQTI